MNILHVIPGLTHERGGPSAVIEALARHQVAAGHRVTVLTTDQGARTGERPTELDPAVQLERVTVSGPNRLAYAPRFGEVARTHFRACDVVHIHSIFTHPVHVALREATRTGVPTVLRPCGQLHRYSLHRSRWLKRAYLMVWGHLVCRACSAWHYTSECERMESWPWREHAHFVIPNGIEPAEYEMDWSEARDVIRTTWPIIGDSPFVLFLGRLHPKKRLDILLEAFAQGAPRDFRLVVAGPDECGLWQTLARRYIRDATIMSRVVRVQTVAGRQKVALLTGASLFALPSEHENFGIAALEALAVGTPVLLSPHVDLAAAVRDAGLGDTAPLGAGAWSERLAATGPAHARSERAAARAWVCAHYSWGGIAQRLLQQYRWVANGCRPQAEAQCKDPTVLSCR